jgi:iron complex transport system substrate-binding protein
MSYPAHIDPVRVVSLVPSATETLFALGLGSSVVAVTHACDYPPEVEALPRVTRPLIPIGMGLDGGRIDELVSGAASRGEPLYDVDYDLIRELEPDLVVAQDVCEVCAAPGDRVDRALPDIPVLNQHPHSLDDALASIRELADACSAGFAGSLLLESIRGRLDAVAAAAAGRARVRGVFLEWLDPPYPAGHWTPDIVDLAGIDDPLGRAGRPSVALSWQQVAAAAPEVLILAPCGMTAPEAEREAERMRGQVATSGATRVVVLDGSSYFSRPGPRLADSAELLAAELDGRST